MSPHQYAALGAAVLLVAVALLQAALALGAPLGAYAWGGAHAGVLPRRLRLGSALSAPILVAMAAIVLIGGGVVLPGLAPEMYWAVWLVFLFMVVNTFANMRSPSDAERRVMAPVTAVLAALVLVVQFATG